MKNKWINRGQGSEQGSGVRGQKKLNPESRVPSPEPRTPSPVISIITIVCHLVMVSGVTMVLTVVMPVSLAWAATEDVSLIRAGQTMSTVARAGNVVTITLASSYPNNNLVVGQSIVIDAVDNTFDGTFVITGVTDQSTFTYAQTAGDVGSTADAGTAGGDYTTLTAWEAGEGGDLVGGDRQETAECYDDWASGLEDAVTIDGNTTDATAGTGLRRQYV